MLSNPIPYFESIIDPRRNTKNKLHPLQSIIFITLCSTLCGYDDWVSIEDFAQEQQEWFKQHIDLPHGIPSHDTFCRVFRLLNPDHFEDCFLRWIQSIQDKTEGEIVAIDGKTVRRSKDKANGKSAIHVVSAWANENKLVLGQLKVDAKTNEIFAARDRFGEKPFFYNYEKGKHFLFGLKSGKIQSIDW